MALYIKKKFNRIASKLINYIGNELENGLQNLLGRSKQKINKDSIVDVNLYRNKQYIPCWKQELELFNIMCEYLAPDSIEAKDFPLGGFTILSK